MKFKDCQKILQVYTNLILKSNNMKNCIDCKHSKVERTTTHYHDTDFGKLGSSTVTEFLCYNQKLFPAESLITLHTPRAKPVELARMKKPTLNWFDKLLGRQVADGVGECGLDGKLFEARNK